ncbi:MAG TPA: hypothetical protein VJ783_26070 [Pirellulales bacterium]|nr:hypothetical protein [Pirellulales bacterium]
MSTNAALVFYGVRFEIDENEIEACERRSDSRIAVARRHGLAHFFENMDEGRRFVLFVGARLGWLGPENSSEVQIGSIELSDLIKKTDASLAEAGFQGPSLYMQWLPGS